MSNMFEIETFVPTFYEFDGSILLSQPNTDFVRISPENAEVFTCDNPELRGADCVSFRLTSEDDEVISDVIFRGQFDHMFGEGMFDKFVGLAEAIGIRTEPMDAVLFNHVFKEAYEENLDWLCGEIDKPLHKFGTTYVARMPFAQMRRDMIEQGNLERLPNNGKHIGSTIMTTYLQAKSGNLEF